MADLINREELLNNRPEYLNPQMEDKMQSARHRGWNDCNGYYYDLIVKQPKVDTDRHAHWIYNKEWSEGHIEKIYNCSACQYEAWGESEKTNYCPYCGAKMDEEVDKNE